MGVIVERAEDATTVRIDHGRVNALDLELCREITAIFEDLSEEVDGGGIVLTGRGSVFSGGVDVTRILAEDGGYAFAFLQELSTCLLAVTRCPRPVVAAVNGHAIAGGAVLARAADVVIAAGPGTIGLLELAVGVPFPVAALEILRVRLDQQRLVSLVLAAAALPFSESEPGLIDRVVADGELEQSAVGEARRLGRVPPMTFALTKRLLLAPLEVTLSRASEKVDEQVAEAWDSTPVRRAIRASVEQRSPKG